jgi:hypothetical protein
MKVSKQFTTVTKLSKTLALIMFVSFPFIGFYFGISYQRRLDKPFMSTQTEAKKPYEPLKPKDGICTMEAKLCPDGSYVGRKGPNCEFTKCPGEK